MSRVERGLLALFALGLAASISLAELALAGLALTVLLRPRARRPRWTWPLALPLGAFAGWTAVAALASARPLESLVAAKSVLLLVAIWVVLHALPDRAAAHRFLTMLFTLVAVVALLAIVQVAVCPEVPPAVPLVGRFFKKCQRAHGFYSIYMTLAGVLTLTLVSALPGLVNVGGPAWRRAAWLAGVVALALTYVRGAWLGFAAGTVVCAVAMRRRAVTLVVMVALVAALGAALPGVMSRVRTFAEAHDDSVRDRLAMLEGGLRMTREHPLTGVGPGQVKHRYPAYAPSDALRRRTGHLHDTPLQILVERGLPGLAAWLWLFGAFFAGGVRTLRKIPPAREDDAALVLGCLAAVSAFLVAGLFEYNFGDTEVLLVACSLMALPFVIERDLPGR